MRAVVQYKYGSLDLLQLKDVARPTPGDDEVLIRVRAAAVTLAETITRKGRPLVGRFFTGLLRPRQHIQGSEFSGEIEVVGRDVKRFKAGDEVFGVTGLTIKRESPFKLTFNISLANGGEGYIPPPQQHDLGGYTTWRARTSCLEREAEPKIRAKLLEQLQRVAADRGEARP